MLDINRTQYSEKEKNILITLDHVLEAGVTSGVDTAKATGISTPTVSRVINELKSKDLVIEVGKETTGVGRPINLVSLNPKFGYLLHFYMGAAYVECFLADFSGKLVSSCKRDLTRWVDADDFCYILKEAAIRMLGEKNIDLTKVLAGGISIPGMVDPVTNKINRIPYYKCFNNTDLRKIAEEILGIPMVVTNGARLCAVGESITTYKNCDNLIYMDITRGNGIGAGIICNGKLLSGKNGLAGEIGYMLMDARSFYRSYDDNEGCFEVLAGVGVLFEKLEFCMRNGRAVVLKEILEKRGTPLTLSAVEEAVLKQDLDVADIFDEVIKMWAVTIVNLTTVLDSDVIILGGVINSENNVILGRLRHYVKNTLNCDINIRLVRSHHDSQYAGGIYFLKKRAIQDFIKDIFTEL